MSRRTAVAGVLAAVAVALAAGAVRWRYAVVTVRGPSMEPDLTDGDRVLVRRCGLRHLRRGQLVIFREPEPGQRTRPAWLTGAATKNTWVIKRVAALPGDPVPESVRAATGDADVVPPRSLVVLGSPSFSRDSRHWGLIPAREVLGVGTTRMPLRGGG
jgi:signal peptidase I